MPVQFIDNASIDKKTRTLIRSHAAKGKNLGRTIHRPSRYPRKRQVAASVIASVIASEKPPSDEGPELFHNSGNIESSLSIQRQLQEDLSTSLPFDYAFIDEAFFHCVVALSVAASVSLSMTCQETIEALSHLSRSLRLVNQRLAGDGDVALSDTTLAVVIAMTQHERLLGYHHHALVHFEGFQRIIALRGGISALVSDCPGIAQKAFRADFDFALQLGSPTRFSIECVPGKATLDWLREKYRGARAGSPYTLALIANVDEDLRGVFEDICTLAWLVNDDAIHGVRVDDYDFHAVLLLVGYRLLDLRPLNTPIETSDTIELLLHLGLAALMTKFFFTLGLKPPDVVLLNHCIVSAALERRYNTREKQELLLWLLFTGKASVFTGVDEDIWLIPKISQVATKLDLSTWDHVSRTLQKFPWVRTFSNDTAQTLWDQICSLGSFDRPIV
ncbi:hypothetical protein E0Z10_g2454 [Xylaria hypoxylon]|uniref:Transcription factor domain-containing protein n=1 Tax=Xylaria hypoxylon TaxID=37992 RepID=A0A4Z0Z2A3_9PEZI|nr:hypothetical protein E0Z10_g2454 [Xylaria hypoxylon]